MSEKHKNVWRNFNYFDHFLNFISVVIRCVSISICSQFTKFVRKTDRSAINNAEDVHVIISMYILWEYNLNYSDKTASLLFYSKDEGTDFNKNIVNNYFQSF